ncbi:unnamed protein product [Triticum turgidum subsp. durum]|uniref:Uncharacterized protein n=1 Tax=Triticum turgidum subsp. durum TaxID=4567 RepID=A0A9R0VNP6_TRITD|nr:unnamed protein product [Triticum turgidum subsp. durum]
MLWSRSHEFARHDVLPQVVAGRESNIWWVFFPIYDKGILFLRSYLTSQLNVCPKWCVKHRNMD